MMKLEHLAIDHVGIATRSLEEASLGYRTLGLIQEGVDEIVESAQARVRAFQAGPNLIELLEPIATSSPIARFLERRGPGLHHIAFRVEDIELEIERLRAEGAPLLDQVPRLGRAGSRIAFLHPRFADGVLMELVEHKHP